MNTSFFIRTSIGNHVEAIIKNGVCYVNAKPILKGIFANPQPYLNDLSTHLPDTIKEGGNKPTWTEFNQFYNWLNTRTAEKIDNPINMGQFREDLFDTLYNEGYHNFLSDKRAKEQKSEEEQRHEQQNRRTAELEKENALLQERLNALTDPDRPYPNGIVKWINSDGFLTTFAGFMMLVLGTYTWYFAQSAMNTGVFSNILFTVCFEIFPIVVAIHGYKLPLFGFKINPLYLTMLAHTVIVAHHFNWENITFFNYMVNLVFVLVVPTLQKSIMDIVMAKIEKYRKAGTLIDA